MRRIGTVCAVALTSAMMVVTPAMAKPPAGTCTNAEPGLQPIPVLPWAQKLFDPETAVWPHSTGKGVTVAVVDSGVDADHPQLRNGKVLAGEDFWLEGDFPGNFDCMSHGTSVASVIAANRSAGVGFAGLAPDATILPVRVTERDIDANGSRPVPSELIARGIRYAAEQGADVINVSLAGLFSSPKVRSAVKYAQKKDALIVAAVGSPAQNEPPGTPSYPASYPGVLGVAGIDNAGMLADSRMGRQVDLVAPGTAILAAARESGHDYYQGSSYAAAFVSGTAALVRARNPKLSAKQVAERIMATTDPARGVGYGKGVVNPYRAVTDRLSGAAPVPMKPADPQYVDEEREAAAAWWQQTGTVALAATGVLAIGTVLGLILVPSFRRARRRGWLATKAAPVSTERHVEGPPDEVFLFKKPSAEL